MLKISYYSGLKPISKFFLIVLLISAAVIAEPSSRSGVGAILYPGGTTFRVWAPNADTVNVAGDFNYWNSSATPLYSESGGWWSADVNGADEADEYRYVIDGDLWKSDPRAFDVVSSVGNSIITDNQYDWDEFTPPAWNDMIIYEMHLGTFYDAPGGEPGTCYSAAMKLDHLVSLGVNAVQLMPVCEFPGSYSLGYNPVNLFAPESAYGTPEQLKFFIDQCHKRGIAVLIDLVYNHLGPSDLDESIWKFDGYSAYEDTGGIYFYENDNRYTPWGDTRLNYSVGEVRSFIRDNVMYWLNEYNMDGLRMDGTAYIRERGIMQPEIPEGWSLMQWINDEIDSAHPEKISIAEDMRDNEWITKSTGAGGAGFDSQWDAGFHHKIKGAVTQSDDPNRNMYDVRDAITNLYNGSDTQRVIYSESHDEAGASSGKSRLPSAIHWDNPESYWAKKRSTLAAGIVFTSPGIPMLFMGQEFLETGAWHDNTPLDWTRKNTFSGINMLYEHLISLRRNLGRNTLGLKASNVNVFHVNNSAKVIAYHRWWNGGAGDDVIILANFSGTGYTNYGIGMPREGRWRVRFNSDWQGYDPEFGNWNSNDTYAYFGSKDGLPFHADVGIGPYSLVVLSQGSQPNMNGDTIVNNLDFEMFSEQWGGSCDLWNSCGGADFNMSGSVDIEDLQIFVNSWLE
ncbi:alpha-amylase family glycosyl hydrolase [Sedimentisphaera salicampi]|uniref:1,4-alpha-glucan branching enzyme n=1 Tax=Sedimentisphaera salicampi TaxID=1941349 RepID=A0A1W6LJN7_9BACT|nr:alpha-amylase family glycosyl hydrolase [Sedimentisphaera salicampi]ARN55966.1 1,4-alpha-glucan branching enzyme GlgB [Sedimentisphaera salicampi]